jgi:hypothetical protein
MSRTVTTAYRTSLGERNRSVVIAVAVMRMMQVAVDKIIHMVSVRHCRVATVGAVHMTGVMRAAGMRLARSRIGSRHLQSALVIVAVMRFMQVAVV